VRKLLIINDAWPNNTTAGSFNKNRILVIFPTALDRFCAAPRAKLSPLRAVQDRGDFGRFALAERGPDWLRGNRRTNRRLTLHQPLQKLRICAQLSHMKTSRRHFLGSATAGCTAAIALRESFLGAAEPASSTEVRPRRFTVRAYDAKGEPLPESALQGLFLFEADGDRNPLPHPKRDVSNGYVSFEAPAAPFGCSLLTNVDGFGTVRLYADADGNG